MGPLRVNNGRSNDDDGLSVVRREADLGRKSGKQALVATADPCPLSDQKQPEGVLNQNRGMDSDRGWRDLPRWRVLSPAPDRSNEALRAYPGKVSNR